jgi:pilus assembly protein Flp/PilA
MQDDSGATAIEYGLIAALVAVAIISALGIMKNSLVNTFNKVANSLDSANSAN